METTNKSHPQDAHLAQGILMTDSVLFPRTLLNTRVSLLQSRLQGLHGLERDCCLDILAHSCGCWSAEYWLLIKANKHLKRVRHEIQCCYDVLEIAQDNLNNGKHLQVI